MTDDSMSIKAFLFDLGNVLVRFSHPRMYAQMGALMGVSAGEIDAMLAKDRLQWRYEAGDITTDDLLAHCRRLAKRPFEPSALLEAASDIFDPIEAMRPVTRKLKTLGYRLVVVSNTNEAHIDFVQRRYDVLEPFDALVLSYAVKAMKPAVAFYEAAIAAARCDANEALFTDDLLENVEGAKRFGFTTAHFTTPETFLSQLRGHGIRLG